MSDDTRAYTYKTPQELWDGLEFDAEQNQIGSTVYHLTDGGKVETYEGGLNVGLVTAGKSVPLDVQTVVRQAGQTTYVLRDGTQTIVANDGNKLTATRYNINLQPIEKINPTQMSEAYPAGITVTVGDTALTNVQTIEHRVDSSIYRSSDSSTQVYDDNHSLPTPFGDVRRVDFLKNDFKRYFKDDGTQILTNRQGIKSPFGRVESIESLPDHTERYTRANGDVISSYPKETPINVLVGRVASALFGSERINANSVETTANGLTLRSDNPAWKSAVIDFGDHTINTFDADGNMLGSRDLPADFKLIRQFPPSFYPDGVVSPYGPVRTIETDANGANTWRMVNGTVHK
jgi:hypothetical protein